MDLDESWTNNALVDGGFKTQMYTKPKDNREFQINLSQSYTFVTAFLQNRAYTHSFKMYFGASAIFRSNAGTWLDPYAIQCSQEFYDTSFVDL